MTIPEAAKMLAQDFSEYLKSLAYSQHARDNFSRYLYDFLVEHPNLRIHYVGETTTPEKTANDIQVGGEHYKTAIEPWDFIVANKLGFLEGNAIKYIARHTKKNGKEDIEKAIHYLMKLKETL